MICYPSFQTKIGISCILLICVWVISKGTPSAQAQHAIQLGDQVLGSANVKTQVSNSPTIDCNAIALKLCKFYLENESMACDPDPTKWPALNTNDPEIDYKLLKKGAKKLKQKTHPKALSFLVIHNDLPVFERYFGCAKPDQAYNIHSVSKSMISALVGIAVEEGRLNLKDPISKWLPSDIVLTGAKSNVTIKHLLTMSAGLKWKENVTEDDIEIRADWIKAIWELPLKKTPGEKFKYNTGLTHTLSAILSNATRKSTCEYAHQKLFDPLGIDVDGWGRDKQSIFSGGCNVLMTPRELAKFGLLYLQRYKGKKAKQPIVPERWVKASMDKNFYVFDKHSEYDKYYGYLWWIYDDIGGQTVFAAEGHSHQYIYLIPNLNSVVVITSVTEDDPPEDDFYRNFLRDFIIPAHDSHQQADELDNDSSISKPSTSASCACLCLQPCPCQCRSPRRVPPMILRNRCRTPWRW